MDAEIRAQLMAAADRAVENYDSGAEPYRSVGEAVIDALLIEQAGWNPEDATSLYPMNGRPAGVMDEDGAWWPATCVWLPVFRLGVLSLPPQKETA